MTVNDRLVIAAKGRGGSNRDSGRLDLNFEDWTAFSLRNSIVEPAEMSLELGDDTAWDRLNDLVQLGSQFGCFIGDRPRMAGRVEVISAPSSTSSTTMQLVIRTKLSDAMYSSAPQGMRLKRATVRDFILAAYEGLGLTESDFDFRGDVSRDLLTGVATKGGRPPPDFERLTVDEGKVQTTETVFGAVDRHLRRHGLLHWDGADGRIIVAAPDDQQDPVYRLRSFRPPNGQFNNVCAITRDFDVSAAPTGLGMFGKGGGRNFAKARVGQAIFNNDLVAAGFTRTIVIIDEGLTSQAIATRRARREFSARSRGLDRLTVEMDGLQYREGHQLIPWSPDTTADVIVETLGGALGTYYVESVTMSRNPASGDSTQLTLVRQGAWVL